MSTSLTEDEWIMDFGGTYHMTSPRDWFSRYRSIDGGAMLMGNNTKIEIAGNGSAQIRMCDGMMRILREA